MCTVLFVASLTLTAQAFDTSNCPHCTNDGKPFEEFLQPESTDPGPHSNVHMLWPTHVEVIPITEDIGGWEPASFHERIADEAISGWKRFRDEIGPSLPHGHPLRNQMYQSHAGALNDGFFHWQKRLFEAEGNFEKSLQRDDGGPPTPPPDAPSSWPEMNALPEYNKLRRLVEKLSRRYLMRSGMTEQMAYGLNYSLFNWCAVHAPGEFHGPHTHVGEYHVGVFYAKAGPTAGKFRLGDPRGHSPPYGKTHIHTPRSGDLVFFPSWLSHMATVSAPTSDILNKEKDEHRVVISFNIGPVSGPLPCHLWWSDPVSDMRITRRALLDAKDLTATPSLPFGRAGKKGR